MTGTELANFAKFSFRGYMSTMSERIWLDNIRVTAAENPSGVNELTDAQRIVPVKGGISVEGFAGQQVRVYTIDGRQVGSFVAGDNGTLSIEPGIYVVTVGKQAMKVIVK